MLFLILGVGYFLVGKKSRKDLMNKIQQNQLAVLGGFILAYFLFVRNNVEGFGECTMTPETMVQLTRNLITNTLTGEVTPPNQPSSAIFDRLSEGGVECGLCWNNSQRAVTDALDLAGFRPEDITPEQITEISEATMECGTEPDPEETEIAQEEVQELVDSITESSIVGGNLSQEEILIFAQSAVENQRKKGKDHNHFWL